MIRDKGLLGAGLGLSLLIILVDQLSKRWFVATFDLYEQFVVIPDYFSFTLAYNTGAAFSFLSSAGGWQRWFFIAIAVAVSAMLVVWMARLERSQTLQLTAFALILGGAVGNVLDRAVLGHVVDFILVHYQASWFFPAFNIADIAISIGAGLMILDLILHPESKNQAV